MINEWTNGAWSPIAVLGSASTSYAVTSLSPGTTYTFEVGVFSANGYNWAASQSATTLRTPPAAPSFTLRVASSSQIELSWNPVGGATGYFIKEWNGSYSGAGQVIAYVGSTGTSYAVSGLSPGGIYYFAVGASNAFGTTWASDQSAAIPSAAPAAPSFVLGVVSSSEIDLAWTAVTEASSYVINEWSWTSLTWQPIASLGSASTRYAVTGLNAGTTYYFQVGAANVDGTTWAGFQSAATLPTNYPLNPVQTNGTWSGYVVQTGSSQVNAVGGTWVQPATSSTGTGSFAGFWVGIDGFGKNNNMVEQLGTSWKAGTGYQAWIELYPAAPIWVTTLTIQPGDTVSAEVSLVSSTSSTSTFLFQFHVIAPTGHVQNWSEELGTPGVDPPRSSAEWIVESPGGGAAPLPNFGTVNFSGAWAQIGSTSGPLSAFSGITALNMAPINVAGGGTDTTSGITNSNAPGFGEPAGGSSSFSVTFDSAHANTANIAALGLDGFAADAPWLSPSGFEPLSNGDMVSNSITPDLITPIPRCEPA